MYIVMWQRLQMDGASIASGFVGPFQKMIDAEEYVEENKPNGTAATIVKLEHPNDWRIRPAPR